MNDNDKKVLIVDDSHISRNWTRLALEKYGYNVRMAEEPEIGDLLNSFAPDLVLMDVEIRSKDGSEAVARLKRSALGARTRIYLYSAKPESELRALAADSNADGYICKPDSMDTLAAKVASIIEN